MAVPHPTPKTTASSRVVTALWDLVLRVPVSKETEARDPRARAQQLATSAARKASAISTGLSLPPGPLGVATILPDLVAIWTIQSKLVADIGATYGRSAALMPSSLVYCLFKHGSAAILRDLVARAGQRLVVRRASVQMLQGVLTKLGVRVTERVVGRVLSRWLPIVGALGVGAYAYYDTSKVAANAIELFESDPIIEDPGDGDLGEEDAAAEARGRARRGVANPFAKRIVEEEVIEGEFLDGPGSGRRTRE